MRTLRRTCAGGSDAAAPLTRQPRPRGATARRVVLAILLLPLAADGAVGGEAVDRLRSWFRRYQRDRVTLHQPMRVAVPSDDGKPVYFRDDGVDELEQLLAAAAAEDGEPAARLLLEIATWQRDRDEATEFKKRVDQQPWLVRRLALETLGALRDPEVAEWLISFPLKDHSSRGASVRRAAATALASSGHPGAVDAIEPLLHDEDPSVRQSAANALGAIGDPAAIASLSDAASDDAPGVRLEALLALDRAAGREPGQAGYDERLQGASDALTDPDKDVRLAATGILGDMRDAAAIPILVAALAREAKPGADRSRRVRTAIRNALAGLTGEDFPSYRPDDWALWWEETADQFVIDEAVEREVTPEQGARFFGIPIEADVVVFALDVSGSMGKPVGGGSYGPSRLSVATRELARCLEDLEDGTRFNILLFSDTVIPFEATPVAKSPDVLKRAVEFIDGPSPEGGTDLFAALRFALGIGSGTSVAVTGGEIDTLVVLTDGTPSRGAILIPDEIRHQIQRANRGRRIAIHTISAGVSESSLLSDLAADNDGVSRVLEVR